MRSSATATPVAVETGAALGSVAQADIPEIMSSLPTHLGFPPYRLYLYGLYLYGGFWLNELLLRGVAVTHSRFKPRPTDVLLASYMKSGTTWLKALAFSTLNRVEHPPSLELDDDHPLRRSSPHDLVRFIETNPDLIATNFAGEDELYGHVASPRLLASHLPYSLLPHGIATDTDGSGSGRGKIVYVCRDPKDTIVSFWHFHEKTTAGLMQQVAAPPPTMPTFEEAFELFCDGRSFAGPQWCHVLEFWDASRLHPRHVLFLRYEEMLRDPEGNLRKLAAFMGCPFSPEEEAAGVVRDIVELCSLGKLSRLEVTKSGSTLLGVSNDAFFRKGTVGDWSRSMTPAMAERLDGIVQDALRGSELTFGSSSNN